MGVYFQNPLKNKPKALADTVQKQPTANENNIFVPFIKLIKLVN